MIEILNRVARLAAATTGLPCSATPSRQPATPPHARSYPSALRLVRLDPPPHRLQPTTTPACRQEGTQHSLLKLCVVKDALRVALDGDLEAGVEELLGRRRRQGRAVLERLGLAAEPELREEGANEEASGSGEGRRRGGGEWGLATSKLADGGQPGNQATTYVRLG